LNKAFAALVASAFLMTGVAMAKATPKPATHTTTHHTMTTTHHTMTTTHHTMTTHTTGHMTGHMTAHGHATPKPTKTHKP
jgi:hypothetical protein